MLIFGGLYHLNGIEWLLFNLRPLVLWTGSLKTAHKIEQRDLMQAARVCFGRGFQVTKRDDSTGARYPVNEIKRQSHRPARLSAYENGKYNLN